MSGQSMTTARMADLSQQPSSRTSSPGASLPPCDPRMDAPEACGGKEFSVLHMTDRQFDSWLASKKRRKRVAGQWEAFWAACGARNNARELAEMDPALLAEWRECIEETRDLLDGALERIDLRNAA